MHGINGAEIDEAAPKHNKSRSRNRGSRSLGKGNKAEQKPLQGKEPAAVVSGEDMAGFKVFKKEMCNKKGLQPQRRVERDRIRKRMMEKWVALSPTKQAKYVKMAKQKRRRRHTGRSAG